jgi:tripartite-type tricarboxylate transporter receptor subunit TctC
VAREYGKGNPNLKSMRKTNTDRVKADNKAISSGSSRYASRGAAKIGKNKTVATSSGTVRTSPSSTAGKNESAAIKPLVLIATSTTLLLR